MKTTTFRLVSMMGMMVVAGCHGNQALNSDQHASATTSSPSSPQLPLVYYFETGTSLVDVPVLSELEFKQVIDAVAKRTTDPIWLIYVKPGYGFRNVTVYLVPDRETPRIRKGRAYEVQAFDWGMLADAQWEYIQISRADQTFTRPLAFSSVSDLPFRQPRFFDPNAREMSPMAEETVIGIADFARQGSNYPEPSDRRMRSAETIAEYVRKTPILSIGTWRGTIHVDFGFRHGPLSAYAIRVEVARTPSGYRVLRWSEWVS
jgi:hypothetical protein